MMMPDAVGIPLRPSKVKINVKDISLLKMLNTVTLVSTELSSLITSKWPQKKVNPCKIVDLAAAILKNVYLNLHHGTPFHAIL